MGILSLLGSVCAGVFVGLALALVVAATARRRQAVSERLAKAYTPLLSALTAIAAAETRVRRLQDKLMSEYSSESSPYSPPEKKAAAEAFLAAEAAVAEEVIRPNVEKVRDVLVGGGYFLEDEDFLTLSERLQGDAVTDVLNRAQLPRELREPRPTDASYGSLLEQIRQRYYDLNAELRAPVVPALLNGIKTLFTSY